MFMDWLHNYCISTTFKTKHRLSTICNSISYCLTIALVIILLWEFNGFQSYLVLGVYYSLHVIANQLIQYLFGINTVEYKTDYERYQQNIDLLKYGFTFKTRYLHQPLNCDCNPVHSNFSLNNIVILTNCGHCFHLFCTPTQNKSKCPYCNILYKNISPFEYLYRNILEIYYYHQQKEIIFFKILKPNEHQIDNKYGTTDCCICYETLDNQINVKPKCEHIFHQTCFKKWIKIDKSCPMCRIH